MHCIYRHLYIVVYIACTFTLHIPMERNRHCMLWLHFEVCLHFIFVICVYVAALFASIHPRFHRISVSVFRFSTTERFKHNIFGSLSTFHLYFAGFSFHSALDFISVCWHFVVQVFSPSFTTPQAQEDNKVIPFILYFQLQMVLGKRLSFSPSLSATLNLFRYFM